MHRIGGGAKIRKQGLFAAGVGAFDLALRRSGVVAVDAVKEDDAGIAALPRLVHQQVEHFAGVEAPLLLAQLFQLARMERQQLRIFLLDSTELWKWKLHTDMY